MTMPKMETYYCSHWDGSPDCPVPQTFVFSIGPARRLVLCEQCYHAMAYLVIEGLVEAAGAEVARHLGSSRLWMDGRFVGARDEGDGR